MLFLGDHASVGLTDGNADEAPDRGADAGRRLGGQFCCWWFLPDAHDHDGEQDQAAQRRSLTCALARRTNTGTETAEFWVAYAPGALSRMAG
jgi:hypothetical protein